MNVTATICGTLEILFLIFRWYNYMTTKKNVYQFFATEGVNNDLLVSNIKLDFCNTAEWVPKTLGIVVFKTKNWFDWNFKEKPRHPVQMWTNMKAVSVSSISASLLLVFFCHLNLRKIQFKNNKKGFTCIIQLDISQDFQGVFHWNMFYL